MSEKPAAEGAKKAGGGKKKLVLVAGVLVLLGGGAGAWFSGVLPRLLGMGGGAAEAAEGGGHGSPAGEGHAAPAAAGHGEGASGHGSAAAGHGAAPASGHGKAEAKADGKGEPGGPLFMELPDIVANLNGGPRRTTFVKLKTRLELSRPEDQQAIQAAMPRVLDLFQGYLRELRPEELRGSAGTYRLREELLARTNLAAPPARVVAVLFTEVLVQ